MLAWLQHYLAGKRNQAIVDGMTDRECQDIGASRVSLRKFAAMPDDVSNRMAQMAAVYGADLALLQQQRDLFLDAVETCHSCGAARQCKSVLARAGVETVTPAEAGFCPNAPTYADCRLQRNAPLPA